METKQLICINCPLGCELEVSLDGKNVIEVKGNNCPLGEAYAKKELTHPERTVCSTVKLLEGSKYCLSVKTKPEIPKDKIFDVMKVIQKTQIKSPVKIGDIIVKNIANTDSDLIATENA